MPYRHFHDFSFHTHQQRPRGGRHDRAIRRRQRPWRIAFILALIGVAVFVVYQVFVQDRPEPAMTAVAELVSNEEPKVEAVAPLSPGIPPAHTVEPAPTATAEPAPIPTRPVPTATAEPTPTLAPAAPLSNIPPHLRHLNEKEYMLGLINAERIRAGAPTVVLGTNNAAQIHAEVSLTNCVSSHWGMDGLKPNHRYNLAGGYQANAENGHGIDYCIKESDYFKPIASITKEIDDAIDGWMGSPGHRENMLDPDHRKVNIGIAWDRYNSSMFQHFEGDYVNYTEPPSFTGGVLSLAGKVKNGVKFTSSEDLAVQVLYEQPPHPLTVGQVSRTYCYGSGLIVASLREPSTGGWFYDSHEDTVTVTPCPDPYDVPADAPPARSSSDAHRLWQQAFDASERIRPEPVTFKWITADAWTAPGQTFMVRADLSELLEEYGDGIYTVAVWDKHRVISNLTFFHGVEPPDTYNPSRWE